MILNRFHYSVFAKSAWYENGAVSVTPFSFVFISFVRTRFETEDVVQIVVAAFSNDPVFGVSIENDAFSYVSVFKSLHFEQRFQMSPFSIVFNSIQFNFIRKIQIVTMYDKSVKKRYLHSTRPK